jgi:translation elongation factor EF-Tu-like GTPase
MNKVDLVDDEELLELVEMEIRELLSASTISLEMTFQLSKVLHLAH